jgi:hypothetical protein
MRSRIGLSDSMIVLPDDRGPDGIQNSQPTRPRQHWPNFGNTEIDRRELVEFVWQTTMGGGW